MVSRLLLVIFSWLFPVPDDLTPEVAAEAAYVLATYRPADAGKCCGRCVGGVIAHGDGHTTLCPCPSGCKCKTKGAVQHPAAVLHPCENGKCNVKQSK